MFTDEARLRWLVFLTLGAACAGPATFKPLDRPALRMSQPRTLAVVKLGTAAFVAESSQGNIIAAFFGPVGSATQAVSSRVGGEALARESRIKDPAIDIGWSLSRSLMMKYSLQLVRPPGLSSSGANTDLSEWYGMADLVLEIATDDWGYRPTGLGRYGVTYDGRVRLVDTRKSAVIAEGTCSSHPLDGEAAPNQEELLKNDAAVLRDLIRSIRDFCLRDYRTRIFGLFDTPPIIP